MKTAIVYHYFERDEQYRDNLVYFLNVGLEPDVDYYFYLSSEATVEFPSSKNLKVSRIKNENLDFGGVKSFVKENDAENYDNLIFLNSSVRGPFMPTYANRPWHRCFTSKLSESTGLIGSSVNELNVDDWFSVEFEKIYGYAPPFPHVQSYAYAISRSAYKHLYDHGFYELEEVLDKDQIIMRYEILQSQILMEAGFSIGSLLPSQKKITRQNSEISGLNREVAETAGSSSIMRDSYFGRTPSPLETIFIKPNVKALGRPIDHTALASFTMTGLLYFAPKMQLSNDAKFLLEKCRKIITNENTRYYLLDEIPYLLQEIKNERPDIARNLKKIL